MIRSLLNKTPYELVNGRKPKLTYLRAFSCKYFVLNNGKEALEKFNAKIDEGIFRGYSSQSKAYKVYNKRTQCVQESVYVIFDESHPSSGKDSHDNNDQYRVYSKVPGEIIDMENGKADLMSQVKESSKEDAAEPPTDSEELGPSIIATKVENRVVDDVLGTPNTEQRSGTHTSMDANDGSHIAEPGPSHTETHVSNWKHKSSHSLHNVITPIDSGIQTRSKTRTMFAFSALLSQIEPKNIKDALKDTDWIASMQEELHQFERNSAWFLGHQIEQLLELGGCSETSLTSLEIQQEIKLGWWFKAIIKRKELIMMKLLLLLQEWNPSEF
ncbi:uncharacterized protein LOC142179884 [Nicotiana tabacum]|uniref:Uncharacterized protein LOC142179884 n=1 Tax=Nicotiana tabacum TaxID=4097 RepID=A0AC58UBK6_TOBAC